MSYQGDLKEDATLTFKFPSRDGTGLLVSLTGSPAVVVYVGSSPTPTALGVTLTPDFNGVVGSNHVSIDTSADAIYAIATDYSVQISSGLSGGISVVGENVADFSIENRFEEVTLAGKTHTGATIPIVSTLSGHTAQTGDSFPLIGTPLGASLVADIATRMAETSINTNAGVVSQVALVDVTTANSDMRGTDGASVVEPDNATITAIAGFIDTEITQIINDVAAVQLSLDNPADGLTALDAAISTRMAETSISTTAGKVDAVALVDANTDIGPAGIALTDLGGMSTAMKAEILAEVVTLFKTQMAESYAAAGVVPTLEQCLMFIQQFLVEFGFVGVENRVRGLDKTTQVAVMTADDAALPTSSTRTS